MFTFSIIIPAFNAEKYLQYCLDSIRIEAAPDLQVILINDGSQDRTGEICDSFKRAHPDQVVFIDKKNQGVSAARNDGISVSEGQYLIFVDADDYVPPLYIDSLRKLVSREADLFVYNYQTVDEDGNILYKNKNHIDESVKELNAAFCTQLFHNLGYQVWNKVFWRKIIVDQDIEFDRKMRWSEDLDFWTRYAMHISKVAVSNEILYNYRMNSAGAVASSNLNSIQNHHKAFQDQLALLECKHAGTEAFRNVTQLYVEHMGLTIEQCSQKGIPAKKIRAVLKKNRIREDLSYVSYSLSARFKEECIRYGFIYALRFYFKVIKLIK